MPDESVNKALKAYLDAAEVPPADEDSRQRALAAYDAAVLPQQKDIQPGETFSVARALEAAESRQAFERFRGAQEQEAALARRSQVFGPPATKVGQFFDRIIKGGFTAELRQEGVPLIRGVGPIPDVSLPIPGLTSEDERQEFIRIKGELELEKGAPLGAMEILDARILAQETRKLPFGVQGALEQVPFLPVDVIGGLGPLRGVTGLGRGFAREAPDLARRIARRPVPFRPSEAIPDAILGDLPNFGSMVQAMTEPNTMRNVANVLEGSLLRLGEPGKQAAAALRAGNPAAFANNPGAQWAVGRAAATAQGEQQLKALFSLWTELAPSAERVFGKVSQQTGKIAAGKYQGVVMDDLFRFPSRFSGMSAEERLFIRRINRAQREVTLFMERNGIPIERIPLKPGENFVSGGVYGKLNKEGDLVELARFPWNRQRGAGKPGFLKDRQFKTREEALAAGYRYVDVDARVAANARAAVAAVAEKNAAEWLLTKIPYRTTKVPARVVMATQKARNVKKASDRLSASVAMLRAGGSLNAAQIKSVKQFFPEAARQLAAITTPTIDDIGKAISQFGREARGATKITQQEFIRTVETLGGFTVQQGDAVPRGVAKQALRRLTRDEDTAIRMLENIYGNASKFAAQTRKDAVANVGRLADDIGASVKNTLAKAEAKMAKSKAFANKVKSEEARIPGIPSLQGKIFTGPQAIETANTIGAALARQLPNSFLRGINQVNALGRFFVLAGDMSPLTIQLLYLMGHNPKVFGKAAEGFVRSLMNPRFQAAYLLQNAETIKGTRALTIASGGGLEFTDILAQAGFLRTNRFLRVPGKALEPFQRGMEGALDVAAIEMRKSLAHLATTPARAIQLEEFINNFTGMSNSRRIGVSPRMQLLESTALLAPRYMRATIGLGSSMVQGGLRGEQARRAMAQSLTSLVAMNVALSHALDDDFDDMVAHLNPADPRFFTWDIGGAKIGFGSKVRSIVAMAGRVFNAVEEGRDDEVPNIVAGWLRGQAAPVISSGLDFGFGRDFNGRMTRSEEFPFVNTDTLETIGVENLLPIWVQSVAFEEGSDDFFSQSTAARGSAEFAGLRARPHSFYDAWAQHAENVVGKKIDQFTSEDRAFARKGDPVGAQLWEEFIADRNDRGRTEEAMAEMERNRDGYKAALQGAIDEAKALAASTGQPLRGDLLREAFRQAGSVYHAQNDKVRSDERFEPFFAKLEGQPPSEFSIDIAQQEYYDIWADPELDSALTGRDWGAHNERIDEFKARYGEAVYDRVREIERINRGDLPVEYQQYRDETARLEEYWGVEEALLKEAGEDELLWMYQNIYRDETSGPLWQRERYATAVGLRPFLTEADRIRKAWRRLNPELDGIVRKWFGNAPLEG